MAAPPLRAIEIVKRERDVTASLERARSLRPA
jgi:hypothetical protein